MQYTHFLLWLTPHVDGGDRPTTTTQLPAEPLGNSANLPANMATTTTGGTRDSNLPPASLPRDQQRQLDQHGGSISGSQATEISYLKKLVSDLSLKIAGGTTSARFNGTTRLW
ncbi:adenylate kinase [Puccinia graminis f. sp. tritici]|uniref:Adenylate kinase n=1 Tax=Puccinia graminis f. sp. tritici TaxID=56615 RepID=A0A5B0LUA7_PUCGR|nr:adenylate kinase [Puccinia graminis f. sp. tritici]